MKKLLPTSFRPQGFTLVELLVVISIIAILAIIGITIFSGVQSRARDGRRQEDIQAIAKALEANKQSNVATYPQILATWFAGGAVPAEPAGYVPKYNIIVGTTAGGAVVKPTAWAATDASPTGGTTIAAGVPATVTNFYSFQVCALLENGTAPNIYCQANSQ